MKWNIIFTFLCSTLEGKMPSGIAPFQKIATQVKRLHPSEYSAPYGAAAKQYLVICSFAYSVIL